MRAEDLPLKELLDLDPKGGVIVWAHSLRKDRCLRLSPLQEMFQQGRGRGGSIRQVIEPLKRVPDMCYDPVLRKGRGLSKFQTRATRPRAQREIMKMVNDPEKSLEQTIYEHILRFPKRIDQMETRSEEACKRLAREIVAIVEKHEKSG